MTDFLLFAGEYYYPAGGWDDFRGAFSSPEDAFAHLCAGYFNEWDTLHDEEDRRWFQWAHVVDVRTRAVIVAYHNHTQYACNFKKTP